MQFTHKKVGPDERSNSQLLLHSSGSEQAQGSNPMCTFLEINITEHSRPGGSYFGVNKPWIAATVCRVPSIRFSLRGPKHQTSGLLGIGLPLKLDPKPIETGGEIPWASKE